MKKRIFNTLYTNIILMIILAFLLTVGTFVLLSSVLYNAGFSVINSSSLENVFLYEWENALEQIERFEKGDDKDIFINHISLQRITPLMINDTYYIRADEKGSILSSNGSIILLNNPQYSNSDSIEVLEGYISTSMSNVEKGDELIEAIIFTPNDMQEITNPKFLEYRFKKIYELDNGTFLVGYYITNFSSATLIIGLLLFIILFIFLFRSRLKYLEEIRKSIKQVSYTDTFQKVEIKYNNELTDIANEVNSVADIIKQNRDNEKEFLLNISHDLRTPLNSILGFAELIKQDNNLSDEKKQKYLGYVIEKGRYLQSLIDEFFRFARVKWNNDDLIRTKVNIQELISQIFEGHLGELKKHDMNFSFDFEEQPIIIDLDVQLFIRAIDNIISNAIKYGRCKTNIKVVILEKSDFCQIEIWNEYEGEIDTKRIFDRYYRGSKARTGSGAGLGLAITKAIIKKHKGTIYAYDNDKRLGIIIKLNGNN